MIRVYQYTLSPFLSASCRFYPSCSEYAHQAIMRHGPLSGLMLAFKRILRCHPYHPGGVDPVPEYIKMGVTARQKAVAGVVKRSIKKVCHL